MASTPQYTHVLLRRDAAEQLWRELHRVDAVPRWEPLRCRRAKGSMRYNSDLMCTQIGLRDVC